MLYENYDKLVFSIRTVTQEQFDAVKQTAAESMAHTDNTSCPDEDEVMECLDWLHWFIGEKMPRVRFLDDPYQQPPFACYIRQHRKVTEDITDPIEGPAADAIDVPIRNFIRRNVTDPRAMRLHTAIISDLLNNGYPPRIVMRRHFYQSRHRPDVPVIAAFISNYGLTSHSRYHVLRSYRHFGFTHPEPELFGRYGRIMDLNLYGIIAGKFECWVVPKPQAIRFHPVSGRLHSEDGPALEWRSGLREYFLHGFRLEERRWRGLIKGILGIEQVVGWGSEREMRAALTYLGAEAVFGQAKTTLVSRTKNGNELWRVEEPEELEGVMILRYWCPSTDKEYCQFARRDHTDPDRAQASRFGLQHMNYSKLIES